MSDNKRPPCADWSAWIGPEVEGATSLGEWTLFMRRGDTFDKLLQAENVLYHKVGNHRGIRRIWFCKEFLMAHAADDLRALMRRINSRNRTTSICFEIPAHMIAELAYLHAYGVFYVKLDTAHLTHGDHICVGPAFNDEAFCLGMGAPVVPDCYLQDIELP